MKRKVLVGFLVVLSIVFLVILIFNKKGNIEKEYQDQTPKSKSVDSNLLPVVFTTTLDDLHFYYHDSIFIGHPVPIRKGITKLHITTPILLFEADDTQTPYLIYPGDSIRIGGEMERLSIIGNRERTNELLFFKLLIQNAGIIYDYIRNKEVKKNLTELDLIQRKIEEKESIRLAFLDSFHIRNPISGKFKEIARNFIESAALCESLLVIGDNKEVLKKENLYSSKIDSCIRQINEMGYTPLFHYNRASVLSLNMAFQKDQDFFITNDTEFAEVFDFIEKKYTGMAKSFLLSKCIYYAFNNKISITEKIVDKYMKECMDDGLKSIVERMVKNRTQAESLSHSNTILQGDRLQSDFSSLLSSFKDSLIFIDFWASWCSPCRSEMPASKKLREEYKKKAIVFVYISIEKDIENWEKASIEEGITFEKSFIFGDPTNAPFIIENKLNSIPRYMLFDKKGEMISSDTPKPSDPQLKILIDNSFK